MSSSEIYDPYAITSQSIEEPPQSLFNALRRIGPGIILAGSIVGSGELILTTALGAKFGFQFLWLILFSCVIKVFVQIELGRFTLSSGKPLLVALNELGGPRCGANWQVWWFIIMLFATTVQLGAMTGGVALALNSAFPNVVPAIAPVFSAINPDWGTWLVGHAEH
ncbi:MAG: Nramp family divalent metal transporter, partial [Planctomycetaceae bacterium]|nr:Nramp family divalent metal transporter [Planctomycetaceae bacterium]